MNPIYDVAILGCGEAGIFAAYELAHHRPGLKVLALDQGRDIYQRDIQEQFSVRRSTATGILQLMEKNGLITRSPVSHDARLKKLTLTPKAVEQHQRIVKGIRTVEERVSQCLTPEERRTFLGLCEKIAANLEDDDRERPLPPGKQGEA